MGLPVKWAHYVLINGGDCFQMRTPNDQVIGSVGNIPSLDGIFVKIEKPEPFERWVNSYEWPGGDVSFTVEGTIIDFDAKRWEEFLRLSRRIIRDSKLGPGDLGL